MSTPAPPRILVTRSEPGASETAARLRAAGFHPIIEPLFALAPIEADIPDFDALAFTSANGARRFALLSPRRNVPVYCVGARTAQAAREAGYADVASAEGDADALAALVTRKLPAGAHLLHAGNEDSRGDLAGRLSLAGRRATFVAIFRAVPVEAPGSRLGAHLAGEASFDAVLIHSPRAGAILSDFTANAARPAPLAVAAISAAAAEPLTRRAQAMEIAATPDEAALISALARLVFG